MLRPKAHGLKDSDAYSVIFVGYGEQMMGYQVHLPDTNKIDTPVHAIFNKILPALPPGSQGAGGIGFQ